MRESFSQIAIRSGERGQLVHRLAEVATIELGRAAGSGAQLNGKDSRLSRYLSDANRQRLQVADAQLRAGTDPPAQPAFRRI